MNKQQSLAHDKWAVVGATDKQDKYGYKIVKILQDNGYSVFPVNPKLDEVAGLKTYDSLEDIPEEIEVVDMVVNPKIGIRVLENMVDIEVNPESVWLQPGARSDKIRDFAGEHNIDLVEDCIYATLK